MTQADSRGTRLLLTLGALNGLAAVGLGAYAAHGLQQVADDRQLAVFATAVQYHGWHALALLIAGMAAERFGGRCLHAAGWLFVIGMLLFCGTLYAVTFGAPAGLGPLTPVGGGAFMLGWAALACGFWKRGR